MRAPSPCACRTGVPLCRRSRKGQGRHWDLCSMRRCASRPTTACIARGSVFLWTWTSIGRTQKLECTHANTLEHLTCPLPPSFSTPSLAPITGSLLPYHQNGAFEFPIHPQNDAIKAPNPESRLALLRLAAASSWHAAARGKRTVTDLVSLGGSLAARLPRFTRIGKAGLAVSAVDGQNNV